jgi:DNA-binding response OmpR family regulator
MPKQQMILVVDDEPTIREVVRKYLERESFKVVEAESGTQVLAMIQEHAPDLVVLDIMLPGTDGLSITRSLRDPLETASLRLDGDIPIILLTALGDEPGRLAGFELGADDYIVKPFSPRELVMRAKAILRRKSGASLIAGKPVEFGGFSLDPRSRSLNLSGGLVELTAKEFDLLYFLAQHPRQVFARAQLIEQVWGYEFDGDDSTVTVHIRRLREKIEPDPSHPIYIQTVWGAGYRFEVPVS